jgi:hypothetical protein
VNRIKAVTRTTRLVRCYLELPRHFNKVNCCVCFMQSYSDVFVLVNLTGLSGTGKISLFIPFNSLMKVPCGPKRVRIFNVILYCKYPGNKFVHFGG